MCGFVHLARFSGFSLQNFLLAITGSYISQSLRCNQITNFKTMKHHIRNYRLLYCEMIRLYGFLTITCQSKNKKNSFLVYA